MKTYTHIARLRYIPSALLIVMLLVMATPNLRADYSVTGNLTVSANSTLSGDLQVWSGNTAGNDTVKTGAAAGDWLHYNWDLGDIINPVTISNVTTTYLYPGFNVGVSSNSSLTNPPASVVLTGYSENTTWVWQQNLFNNLYYNGTNYPQMQLGSTGVLTLFSSYDSSLSNITIDPGNQTISFNNNDSNTSVNITHSGSTMVLNGSGVTFGSSSVDSAVGALALLGGNVTASGNNGLAIGGNSVVSAVGGFALGGGNVGTAGIGGLAFDGSSYANATGAIAFGNGTTAEAWSTMTVGHYNANITGNSTTWASTDPAFIVGTGNSTTRANGLVVLNNGNTTVGGNLTVSGNVTGNVTMTGNVTISEPQGDIPMGVYGGE